MGRGDWSAGLETVVGLPFGIEAGACCRLRKTTPTDRSFTRSRAVCAMGSVVIKAADACCGC